MPLRYMAYRRQPQEVSSNSRTRLPVARPHTSSTPIGSLPAELLIKIFEYLTQREVVDHLPPWKLYKEHKGWIQASLTCRAWYRVATKAANLWRTIDVDFDLRALSQSLANSGRTTVNITFHAPEVIPQALRLLKEHAARINKLLVVALDDNTVSALTPLLTSVPMPSLTELWINTLPHSTNFEVVPHLNPYLLPRLRVLQFTNLRFNWFSHIVFRLRRLYVGRSPGQDCLRYDDFLRVLEQCQGLEFLKMDRAFPATVGGDRSQVTIALPHLRDLYFVTEYPLEVRQLLSHIRLDSRANVDVCVRVDIETYNDSRTNIGLLDVIPQDSSCLPILRNTTFARIKDFDFECWGPRGQGRLSVQFSDVQADSWQYTMHDAVQQVGQLLSRAPLSALSIYQEWSDPIPTASLAYLLSKLHYLTALEYSGLDTSETDLSAVLTPTSAPAPSPRTNSRHSSPTASTAISPPWARLRSLRVFRMGWDANFLRRLKESLRARYVAGTWLDSLHIEMHGRVRDPRNETTHMWDVGELQKLVRGPTVIYG